MERRVFIWMINRPSSSGVSVQSASPGLRPQYDRASDMWGSGLKLQMDGASALKFFPRAPQMGGSVLSHEA